MFETSSAISTYWDADQFVETAIKTPISVRDTVSVIGLGYVGFVSAACLAKLGHRVIGVDICQEKLDQLAAGTSTIHEPGLDEVLEEAVRDGFIETSNDIVDAVHDSDVSFVSVNTPTDAQGGCDSGALKAVAKQLGLALRTKRDYHLIVMRCSVPPGMTTKDFLPLVEEFSGKREGEAFGLCFNPEFLRESTAIDDFENPPKTIIGTTNQKAADKLAHILAPIDDAPIITDIKTAEMVKYVDNVWHATKVCFGNEIGRICQSLGVDGHEVIHQFSQDTVLNISAYYLKPGFAYGGSCLPKEVRAMNTLGAYHNLSLPMIKSLIESNEAQIQRAYDLIKGTNAERVGICGITFKPNTNDLRESPILDLAERLLNDGIDVHICDPSYSCSSKLAKQIALLRPHYSRYADIIERLTHRVHADIDELLRNTDTIVAAHDTENWHRSLVGKVRRHNVVDLARLFHTAPSCRTYQGTGW